MDETKDTHEDTDGETPGEIAFVLAESPSHLLHRAQQFAAELFADLYDKHVTLRQFAVLAAVQSNAGGTQTDLVNATGIDRSTLAEMIARMEKKGLVVREKSNADGRAKSVRLTGRGRARLSEAAPHARAADEAILNALPKPKRRALLDILQALTPAIDAAHAVAEPEAAGKKARRKKKKAKPERAPVAVTAAKPRKPQRARSRDKTKT